jgi:ADP-heptose:LPS heptosyltransferase
MSLKRLELAWRRLWIRLLVRLMRRPGGAHPDWGARPHRVLFLRHDRAGDMILSTGVMRAVARSYPTISLDVLASPANAAILDAADYVHETIVFDKKRLAGYLPTALRLRRARYDAVIDCMVTAPSLTTLLLVAASGARHRVGIAGRGNDAAFTVTVPPETRADAHMVDLLAALSAAFDVEPAPQDKQPSIALTNAEREWAENVWGPRGRRRVLVNVSAGTPARLWANDKYVSVMRHLHQLDAAAVFRVIGAPAESARAESIAREGGGEFVRTPGIRHAFALVATADFVFTPDTSIAHAASAFGIPTVAMYLRGTSQRWGLYGIPGESLEHPASNLDTLTVDRVVTAIDAVWPRVPLTRPG